MPSNPWTKFYWKDWEDDPGLRLCSLAAQGLWMRLLCLAAKAEPFGYVLVNGRSLSLDDLAVLIGRPASEMSPLMDELARNGVFSRDGKQRIYNRRMVRDDRKAKIARQNGKLGGNPSLCGNSENRQSDNPQDKGGLKTHKPRASTRKEETDADASAKTEGIKGHDRRSKGARIPPDWQPRPETREFAESLGLDPGAVRDEIVDYWAAVPGGKGLRLDWDGTYRNRCRDLAKRGQGNGNARSRQDIRGGNGLVAAAADVMASIRNRR